MRKALLFLAVVLPMLLNPAAHAAVFGCEDLCNGQTNLAAKDTPNDAQEEGKTGIVAHHCVCSHAAPSTLDPASSLLSALPAPRGILAVEEELASIVVGPPLEPPSIA